MLVEDRVSPLSCDSELRFFRSRLLFIYSQYFSPVILNILLSASFSLLSDWLDHWSTTSPLKLLCPNLNPNHCRLSKPSLILSPPTLASHHRINLLPRPQDLSLQPYLGHYQPLSLTSMLQIGTMDAMRKLKLNK